MRRVRPSNRETGLAIAHKWLKLWRGTVERALGEGPDKTFYLSLIRCLLGLVSAYRKWSADSGVDEAMHNVEQSRASSLADNHLLGQLEEVRSKRFNSHDNNGKGTRTQARSHTTSASLLEHLQHKQLSKEEHA